MSEPQIGRHRLLKDLNHKAVLDLLAGQGSLSRVDISDRLTLSQASVSRIVESLSNAGLVREEGLVASRPGRPQVLVGVDPGAASVASVNLRPGQLRARLADLLGAVIAEVEVRTEKPLSASQRADQVVTQVLGLLRDQPAAGELVALTVGVAAAWDDVNGRVYAARTQGTLEGVDLVGLLRERLAAAAPDPLQEGVTIEVDNDVNLAASGESVAGVASGEDDFFYLSLGSGVGGAVMANGTLYRGVVGFAGEIGYLQMRDRRGRPTDLEQRVSTAALQVALRAAGSVDDPCDVLSRDSHDAAEERVIAEFAEDVAVAIGAVTALLNPRLVVLGGALGSCCERLLPRIDSVLRERLPVTPKVVVSRLGRDVALVGGLASALTNARVRLLRTRLD